MPLWFRHEIAIQSTFALLAKPRDAVLELTLTNIKATRLTEAISFGAGRSCVTGVTAGGARGASASRDACSPAGRNKHGTSECSYRHVDWRCIATSAAVGGISGTTTHRAVGAGRTVVATGSPIATGVRASYTR